MLWTVLFSFEAGAQEYPTVEKHIAALIRQGYYADATNVLEQNIDQYKNDTSKAEYFNWLSELYLHQKQWDKYITLYSDYHFAPGEDSTVLSGARFFRQYPETIKVIPRKTIVQFKPSQSGTPMIEMWVNGKKYRFWVDTGAGLTVVSSKLAKKCKIKTATPGNATARAATGNQVGLTLGVIESLDGAGIFAKNHPCLVIDKNALRIKTGRFKKLKIDGILGWNMLQELDVTINYPEKTIQFLQPKNESIQSDRNFFWMGQPLVNVTSEKNEPLLFFIDTGASAAGVYETFYSKTDTSTAIQQTIGIGSVGGIVKYKTLVFPEIKLTVGGQTLLMKNVPTEPKHDNTGEFAQHGVIGTKEIKNYILHFNMKEGLFELRKP